MIADVALRWVVTVLFALSIAECAHALAAHHGAWPARVNHTLHLVMSMAMIVMVWPFGMNLPTFPPMVFFVLAALWFAGLGAAVSTKVRDRLVNAYHAVMMAAMAWMYAVMNGHVLSGNAAPPPNHPGMNMPGMDMAADEATTATGQPGWITTVDGLLVIVFAVATIYWVYRYVAVRRTESGATLLAHAGVLCQAFVAAGMTISFAVMT
jgi:hypothetical protein